VGGVFQEDMGQRVDYSYDIGGYENTWGRLSAVSFRVNWSWWGGCQTGVYRYGYTTSGRVTRKTFDMRMRLHRLPFTGIPG
jgi:hypothetical protein